MSKKLFNAPDVKLAIVAVSRDCFPESHAYRIISILFQKGIVNDADDVTAMVVPKFIG